MDRARFEDAMKRRPSRRRVVVAGAAGLVALSLPGRATRLVGAQATPAASPVATPTFTRYPFGLGVASGDPRSDSVVLWTRLAPDPLAPGGTGGMDEQGPVEVRWEVAEDEAFSQVVRRGTAVAAPELAHSVHVDVEGLGPRRDYFYRFLVGTEVSPIGRTRTAPAPDAPLDRMTFAFTSCSHWEQGYWPAYRHLAEEDLDLVVHLGDYIYENGPASFYAVEDLVRLHTGPTCVTLEDWRTRHALYKSDPALQAAHAAHPWAAILDNHDAVQDGETTEQQLQVRAAAYQAWYEHLPVRPESMPQGPAMQSYRRLSFGDLAEIAFLDTRQYKSDQQLCGQVAPPNETGNAAIGPLCPQALDAERTMLGPAQERWLLDGLDRSTARWNVIAQTIFMAQFDYDPGPDELVYWAAWDGYPAARARILGHIMQRRPSNPVVLTGDWHSTWVNDLKADFRDPASETLATEFISTSISSRYPGNVQAAEKALAANPQVKFFNGDLRGYTRCTLDHRRWLTDVRTVESALTPDSRIATRASFAVADGRPGAERL